MIKQFEYNSLVPIYIHLPRFHGRIRINPYIYHVYRQSLSIFIETIWKKKKISLLSWFAILLFELKISFTSSMIKTVTPISISPMNSKTYSRIQIETALRLSPLRICGCTLFLDSTYQHTHIAVWTNVYRGEDYPNSSSATCVWLRTVQHPLRLSLFVKLQLFII